MVKHIIRKTAVVALLCAFAVLPSAAPVSALTPSPFARVASSVSDACAGIGLTGGNCGGQPQADKVNGVIVMVVNLLTSIVGVVAVIMIVIGGLKFITSAGDSSKAAGARSTILYAIVGLIVVALAQVIVHFVLQNLV